MDVKVVAAGEYIFYMQIWLNVDEGNTDFPAVNGICVAP